MKEICRNENRTNRRDDKKAGKGIVRHLSLCLLYQLENGPVRFNELLRRIDIAQGTLSNQLKYLEKEGMIRRNVYTEGGKAYCAWNMS